jgi:hypothetical protein
MSKQQHISIFGNPLIKNDSLPIRILPKLEKAFPDIVFTIEDPSECLERNEEDWWIIDTVMGIDGVELIEDISRFEQTHSVSVHEYDVSMDLKILQKLGKLKNIHIIGVSQKLSEKIATDMVISCIYNNYSIT